MEQFSVRLLSISHLSEWAWSKGNYWHSKVCFLHWPSPWNRQMRKIEYKALRHFISSNIPASPAYGVYISKLIRYSRVCAQYSDVLDIYQQLTQKLLNKGTLLLSWNPSTRSDWPLRKMHISNNSESFTFCIDCWVHHWIFGGVRVAQHFFDLLPKLSVSLEFAPILSSGVHLVYFVLIHASHQVVSFNIGWHEKNALISCKPMQKVTPHYDFHELFGF